MVSKEHKEFHQCMNELSKDILQKYKQQRKISISNIILSFFKS